MLFVCHTGETFGIADLKRKELTQYKYLEKNVNEVIERELIPNTHCNTPIIIIKNYSKHIYVFEPFGFY